MADESFDISDTQQGSNVWNVAGGYVAMKILSPLVEMDKLIKIATYGCEHIEDSPMVLPELKVRNRLEALYRLKDDIKLLISNAEFVFKKEDLALILEMKKRLSELDNVLDACSIIQTNDVTKESRTLINESHFNLCINELIVLKTQINTPINHSNLIFPSSDEIDLNTLADELIHGG